MPYSVGEAAALGVVLLPSILALVFRSFARLRAPDERARAWGGFRLHTSLILLCSAVGWWAIWVANRQSGNIARFEDTWFEPDPSVVARAALFWLPPAAGLSAFLVVSFATDGTLRNLRWGPMDTARQAWWRLFTSVIPLLVVALGFDELFAGSPRGAVYIVVAALLNRVGTVFLRLSSGFDPHSTKSGELRNRTLALAHKMGVSVSRIYLVPAGKGHLTNAYASSRGAVALTDNLGQFLNKPQIDSVIAHELAHLRLHHLRKQILAAVVCFSVEATVVFSFRASSAVFRPWVDIALLVVPVLVMNFLSRRFEYAADRTAIEFTGDPASAISALVNLHALSAAPIRWNRLTDLFQTHPAFPDRARAIADAGELPPERVAELLATTRLPRTVTKH